MPNVALYSAPATIALSANAADSDGTVARVDFFDGGTLVGTATAAPYGVTLTNVAAGAHTLTARATDNLGATGTSAPVNVTVDAPPTVTLTAPANNAILAEPASVGLSATASDAVGTVTKVDFYQGTTLIGTSTAAPYTFAWISVPAGNYSLTAVATNDAGGTSTSAPIAIKVDAAPTVSLSVPANVFAGPASIALTASAADTVGNIAKVDFYQGTTLIGTATAAPYSFTWTGVAAGLYSLTAVATNDAGTATTSAAVPIAVDAAPLVSLAAPANNAVFAAPGNVSLSATASDAVGNVTKVDFYQGTTLIGTSTTAPYTFNWLSVPAGNYSLTAVATNNAGGASTSAPIAIKVDAAPTVTLDAPAANAVFATSATIALSATASDTVGNITKVDFYQGTTLIGTATASPFTFSWTNAAAGAYSLTAVATNDAGMTATSSTVAIAVDAAPSISISNPADGSSFTAPANIAVAVTVGDTVGTVTRVDFYQGGTLITTATAAPFGFTWTNVPAGNYSLTAVATNDAGETTTSAAVSVTVKSGVAQVYYIETDHLNTPRLIEDQNQQVVWRWDQGEPFGNDVPNSNPSGAGAFDFPLRFPGQYFDRETNLAYNWMRDYDAGIGRYVESDLIGIRADLNTYAYVGSGPIGRFDPEGLSTCEGVWSRVKWEQDDSLIARITHKFPTACRCNWTCITCDGSPGSIDVTYGTIILKNPPVWARPRVLLPGPPPYDCDCPEPGPSSHCQCRRP